MHWTFFILHTLMTKAPIPLSERPRSGPYSGLNANSARRFLTKQFEQAGLGDCEVEARDLVMAATGLSRTELITQGTEFVSPEAFDVLQNYSTRRLSGEPVDHILGWRDFFGRRFAVNSDVLSPRQETEEVLAKGLEMIAEIAAPKVLDLGTGSGAIIVTLLCEHENAIGTATDISNKALSIAGENAKGHCVANRLRLLKSDWFSHVSGRYDLIISNPPYIDSRAMGLLPNEVAKFDPALALHGGEDGLDPYRLIAARAQDYLVPNGALVLEIGFDQGNAVTALLTKNRWREVQLFHDIFGQHRIMAARSPS